MEYDNEQLKAILGARYDYLQLLKAGIKQWVVLDDEEQKRVKSITVAIDKYIKYILESYNKINI